MSPRSRAVWNSSRKWLVAATADGLGRHREDEPVEQLEPGARARSPGPDGPPGRSHTTTSNASPQLAQGRARPRGGPGRPGRRRTGSTAIAGDSTRASGRRDGRLGTGEVLDDRAPHGQASGDVQGKRVGVHHANPGRHRAVSGQARGEVRRHTPLALWILGRGHTHGKSRHEWDNGAPGPGPQHLGRAVIDVTGRQLARRLAGRRPRAGSGPSVRPWSRRSDAEFMQYRSPVGRGPSGNTWPRWAPQLRQTASVRIMPWLWSTFSSTASALEGLEEARPAGARLELRVGREQRRVATDAHVGAVVVAVPVLAGEGPLGAGLAGDLELGRGQALTPLVVGLGELVGGVAGIPSPWACS